MKNVKNWMSALCMAAVVFTACDKDDDNNDTNNMDREFVNRASISNNAEVMAGQVAVNKAVNNRVRMYGQMMVTEHTAAQAELRNQAQTAGLQVHDSVDAQHRALMAMLNSLSGYAFDTAYMGSQVRDHAKTIDLFNRQVREGNNQNLRSYAQQQLPALQRHYNQADSIRRSL